MPTSARPTLCRTPRQGTRALPYKVLRYRARADRVVRPYKPLRRGDPCGRPPTYPLFPFNFPLPAKKQRGLRPAASYHILSASLHAVFLKIRPCLADIFLYLLP